MRTLKYRAYIKPLKRYAEKYETILYHHQCNMEPSWTVNISPEEYYGDEDLVIEQFTGLLDRNGKEIYEGDIVKRLKSHEFLKNVEETEIFRIRWGVRKAGFFAYSKERKKHNIPAKRLNANDVYEVIGNIHESPKDFRPEHLKRMGVSISKGGEE